MALQGKLVHKKLKLLSVPAFAIAAALFLAAAVGYSAAVGEGVRAGRVRGQQRRN